MVGPWQVPHKIHDTKIQSKNLFIEVISQLNQKIDNLQFVPDLTPQAKEVLKEQKAMLNEHLKNKARGALIRSRFQHLNETDSCTCYFFNLEKTTQSLNPFLKFVSPLELSPKTQQRTSIGLTLKTQRTLIVLCLLRNLTVLSSNKSPGLDGLTSEFVQAFWPLFKNDLFSVLNSSPALYPAPFTVQSLL